MPPAFPATNLQRQEAPVGHEDSAGGLVHTREVATREARKLLLHLQRIVQSLVGNLVCLQVRLNVGYVRPRPQGDCAAVTALRGRRVSKHTAESSAVGESICLRSGKLNTIE